MKAEGKIATLSKNRIYYLIKYIRSYVAGSKIDVYLSVMLNGGFNGGVHIRTDSSFRDIKNSEKHEVIKNSFELETEPEARW